MPYRSLILSSCALPSSEAPAPVDITSLELIEQAQARYDAAAALAPIRMDSSALRDCAFVATQNSAVAFDGMILGKPAVLFAQIDFHHAALNVADLGAEAALARAADARPPLDRYVHWFLRTQAIDAQAPDAGARMLAAMRRGGWPL